MLSSVILVLSTAATTVYVSPNGNDSWAGTKDKPLRTLHAAQELEPRAGKTVWLDSGVYEMSTPLILTLEDSGSSWRALPGAKPILSGAQSLDLKWSKSEGNVFHADVELDEEFGLLYVNGERMVLARYPNFQPGKKPYGGTAPDAISKERIARWKNPVGARVHGLHKAAWGGMHYRIAGVDTSGEAILEGGWQNNRSSGLHVQQRFVENVFEEMDAPGEWFYDRPNHRLYFVAPENLDLEKAEIKFARLSHIIEIRGAADDPVKDINISGIKLTQTKPTYWENKEPLLRSDWTTYRGGALFATGISNCTFDLLNIDDVGGNGIFFSGYVKGCSITRTRITKAGANGICFVGMPSAVRTPAFNYNQTHELKDIDMTPGPRTNEFPASCKIEDCLIFDFGQIEKQVSGVQISMSSEITVRSTSIYDCPRAGINISEGTWGGHLIEFCDVFNTVLETGDHGSFNSWGRDRFWHPDRSWTENVIKEIPHMMLLDAIKPTILRNNRWRCDRGWDIDLDDGSSNYILENNLCLNGGIKLREGYNRIVRNNITINNGFHPHVWYQNSGDIVEQNIFGTGHKPIRVGEVWGRSVDNNFYAISQWPESGHELQEANSIIGNPLYTNPAILDFRPMLESAAYQLGFKAFAMDRFGVQYQPLKREAKTPKIPEIKKQQSVELTLSEPLPWLGGMIKSMGDTEEASAYGALARTGIVVLNSPEGSRLHQIGVRNSDVMLMINGLRYNSAARLAESMDALAKGTEIILMRDQVRVTIRT